LENQLIVSDLQVNESDVVWYTASSAGVAFSTNSSFKRFYYGAIQDSAQDVRPAGVVSVTDPGTPTIIHPEFRENNPKVADIQVNESMLVYNSSRSGLAPTAALTSGSY
jgi:hypothetical protein